MSIVGMRNFMQGRMQYIMLALAVIMAAAIVGMMTGAGRGGPSGQDESGGVLAKVNGVKIDRQEFELQYQKQTDQQQKTNVPTAFEEAQLRGRLFDQMVDQMLRVQAAEKAGVKVSRGEVKAKINELMNMRIGQLRDQVLANRKGKKTDEALDAELRRSGTSLAQVKDEIKKALDPKLVREQILIDKYTAKLKEGIDTSDRAVKESFDEVRLAQITVSGTSRSMTEAEQRAKDILAKLRAGGDFATLASQYSEDSLKANGGDQGSFTRRSSMSDQMADVAFRLKVGEVGGPIKQPDGFLILKAVDRRSALPPDFNDPAKNKGYRDAYLQQQEYRVQMKFENDMRQSASIVINDPELKAYMISKDIGQYLGPDGGGRAKAKIKEAIQQLNAAVAASAGNSPALARCYSQIAYLYYAMAKTPMLQPTAQERVDFAKKATEAVNEALKYTESNDLRMMLADLYIDSKDYDKALAQLKYVSDNEFYDYNTHMQILHKYEAMKSARPQIVAQRIADEQKWTADYQQRMQEAQTVQPGQQGPQAQPGQPAPQTQPAPVARQTTKPFRVGPTPKPGG